MKTKIIKICPICNIEFEALQKHKIYCKQSCRQLKYLKTKKGRVYKINKKINASEYYKKYKDSIKRKQREYYEKNKESEKKRHKKYYEKHKDEIKRKQRESYEKK
jgi:hypothetical protein